MMQLSKHSDAKALGLKFALPQKQAVFLTPHKKKSCSLKLEELRIDKKMESCGQNGLQKKNKNF